jgi:prophage antirepressor-like protein
VGSLTPATKGGALMQQVSMFDQPANGNSDGTMSFAFGDTSIRIVKDVNGEPLFVAVDVARAIGIKNSRDALTALDDDQKADVGISYTSGKKTLAAVTESGLYQLIFSGRKEAARAFSRWVTDEVLPQIRRTGAYIPEPLAPAIMPPKSHIDKVTYAQAVVTHGLTHSEAVEQVQSRRDGIDIWNRLQATISEFVSGDSRRKFSDLTNAEYLALFNAVAADLKAALKTKELRSALHPIELNYLKLAEQTINELIRQAGPMSVDEAVVLVQSVVEPLGELLRRVRPPIVATLKSRN